MTEIENAQTVSIDQANREMFKLYDELMAVELEADAKTEEIKAKRAELKAAGYGFNLRDGAYRGNRPVHDGPVTSIREREGY